MNTIEEQLWNYIDGNCTAEESNAIAARIATDEQVAQLYAELMEVNATLQTIELDEPSMSFTRNVMEQVKVELKPVALKTKVDQRIVYAIGAFFVAALVFIFGYAIANSNVSFEFTMPKVDLAFAHKLVSPTTLKIFLFVDVILALIYIDSYVRKGKNFTTKKEAK